MENKLIKDEIYKVIDESGYWMIGKHICENNNSDLDHLRAIATLIDPYKLLIKTSWCYKVTDDSRNYSIATQEEKHWLNICIDIGALIPKEMALNMKLQMLINIRDDSYDIF